MQTTISAYDEVTRTVTATFTIGEIVHERAVNACHTAQGAYDAEATEARVNDVARGVVAKVAVGAIVNPPPPPELPDLEAEAAYAAAAESVVEAEEGEPVTSAKASVSEGGQP